MPLLAKKKLLLFLFIQLIQKKTQILGFALAERTYRKYHSECNQEEMQLTFVQQILPVPILFPFICTAFLLFFTG